MKGPGNLSSAEDAQRETEACRLSLAVARLGDAHTHPNPRVGAVAVRGGRILGLGAHLAFGGRHAERVLLDSLPDGACEGADICVSLEPCAHEGQTPPCAPALIRAKVRRVVVGLVDPNPEVAGRGVRLLKKAGILVQPSRAPRAAANLIAPFLAFQKWGRAWVTLKAAVSLDGRVAAPDGTSQWISSGPSRERVHRWRASCDAILIGRGTLFADLPRLTARPRRDPLSSLSSRLRDQLELSRQMGEELRHLEERWPHQPVRVVVDPRAASADMEPVRAHLETSAAEGGRWVIAHTDRAPVGSVERLEQCGVSCWGLPSAGDGEALDLGALLVRLGNEGLLDVMVEGGGRLTTHLVRQGLVDRFRIFQAPLLLGGERTLCGDLGLETISDGLTLVDLKARRSGADLLTEAYSRTAAELLDAQVKVTEEIL